MSGSSRPRVLIADDHIMVAEAFKKLLEADFEVVGIVQDGQALVDFVSNSIRTWCWSISPCLCSMGWTRASRSGA